jgi:hypothetical protein
MGSFIAHDAFVEANLERNIVDGVLHTVPVLIQTYCFTMKIWISVKN